MDTTNNIASEKTFNEMQTKIENNPNLTPFQKQSYELMISLLQKTKQRNNTNGSL